MTNSLTKLLAASALAVAALTACTTHAADEGAAANKPAGETLRQAAKGHFLVGCALMTDQLDNPAFAKLVAEQFSSVTPENEMKPDFVHPEPGVFTFEKADKIVDFAEAHDMKVIGHCLLWHQQTAKWMFEDESGKPLPREKALANLKEHIQTVMKHYKGRVYGWDVVNEAVDDAGPYLRDTPALRAIGEDYVARAFEFAREADPAAKLYYNDYNIEVDYKREKAVKLLKSLEAAGVKPDALGIQGHWLVGEPGLDEIERGIKTFTDMGYQLMFTEVDVDPLPRGKAGADLNATEAAGSDWYKDGMPPEAQAKLAQRYKDLMGLILKYDADVTRVTFWGTTDDRSWLNDFPVKGRTNHPLLFDRDYQPKPAFEAVIEALEGKASK